VQRVSCEGAPRDLGLDQGRACRDAIRADARALGWQAGQGWLDGWHRLRPGGPARPARPRAALVRDLARHFPHLDERTTGLAAGAGLPREALLVLLEEELGDAPVAAAGVARDPEPGGAPRIVVRLRAPLPPTGLLVRHTRPDGGYPLLALTRPALCVALAGVNERGLAGAVEGLDPPAARAGDPCGVSGVLLLDQCLERLDSVEKALEWCERRPGGGRVRLVFADAAGAVGSVELDGDARLRREAPGAPAGGDAGASLALVDPAGALELRTPGADPVRVTLERR
jgi:hypothetical protein